MPAQEGDSKGLLDQSVSGGQIGKEVQDAKQGKDTTSREIFREEAERDFAREGGLTPYGRNPDNREEVKDTLGFTSRED